MLLVYKEIQGYCSSKVIPAINRKVAMVEGVAMTGWYYVMRKHSVFLCE